MSNDSKTPDWREDYAYTLGMQAYVFGVPWVVLTQLRYTWVIANEPKKDVTFYMGLNRWWHGRNLITADYRDGGSPNDDTLYSMSMLDLSKEPIVLSHPDISDRYFTFELGSATSDNFGYVGSVHTGSKAGHFALVGPDWNGKLPDGVQLPQPSNGARHIGAKATSPTNYAMIFGRTAVLGKGEVPMINSLQDQYKLTPLSLFGKDDAKLPPPDHDVTKPFDKTTDPLADWKTINREMTANPPMAQHAVLVDMFKTIGVGPGQDVTKMHAATQKGLARAAKDGWQMLLEIGAAGGFGRIVNGFAYPPPTMGSAGYFNDFTTMGAIQCMEGLISNDPSDAVYMNTHVDTDGDKLNGANNYTIHFEAGALPPVKKSGFWSLSMYDMTNNFTANPINRYAIGSNQGNYKIADDGSLTLYVQHESPGKEKEVNWLPTPKGQWWIVMRIYVPSQPLVDQTWEMPGMVKGK